MAKVINNFKPFDGQHCETTATETLLRQLDIELSQVGTKMKPSPVCWA